MQQETTLTSKGQVTIPKPIREELNLETDSKLVFSLLEPDLIVAKPLPKIDFLRFGGSVTPKRKPEDFAKIRQKTQQKMVESVVNFGKRSEK